jgi:hypothetical protein
MSDECVARGLNLEFKVVRAGSAPAGSVVTATCQLSVHESRDCPML